jgi:hypothetical protein
MTEFNETTNTTGSNQRFEDKVRQTGDGIAESLDRVVDKVGDAIGGPNGNKVLGGAAVGVLAAVVLPISLGVGAVLGAGYAAYRQMNK